MIESVDSPDEQQQEVVRYYSIAEAVKILEDQGHFLSKSSLYNLATNVPDSGFKTQLIPGKNARLTRVTTLRDIQAFISLREERALQHKEEQEQRKAERARKRAERESMMATTVTGQLPTADPIQEETPVIEEEAAPEEEQCDPSPEESLPTSVAEPATLAELDLVECYRCHELMQPHDLVYAPIKGERNTIFAPVHKDGRCDPGRYNSKELQAGRIALYALSRIQEYVQRIESDLEVIKQLTRVDFDVEEGPHIS